MYLQWNPAREIFVIPVINHPIAWYGVLFAFGFFVAYYIFNYILLRFLLIQPELSEADIIWSAMEKSSLYQGSRVETLKHCNALMGQLGKLYDKKPRAICFLTKRLSVDRSTLAKGRFALAEKYKGVFLPIQKKTHEITEILVITIILGTIIGARLGHILFYDSLNYYMQNPMHIFMTWEGGLASHGGILGIFIALTVAYKRIKPRIKNFEWLDLLDLLVIPAAFTSICIRIGNFINQEILGSVTQVPWAIQFLDPMNGVMPLPRHPAQLYEAFLYLSLFVGLLIFWHKGFGHFHKGTIAGLFFLLLFSGRFVIEFYKLRQSSLLPDDFPLLMGQILSIPFILFGIYLLYLSKKKRSTNSL